MNKTVYQHIIVGAGFSGLCMAIRLHTEGMEDFVILERNGYIGGTWYDNAYPGAACDVESHLYSFSFEPNPSWSRQYGPQSEILRYMEHCVQKYRLTGKIHLNCNVTKAVFDESHALWHLTTAHGEQMSSRHLITCSGGLSQPSFPDIKGLESYAGRLFHTARWDHSFELTGKTVAVIGTGASAIQVVPAIASEVAQLRLFQRTAPWIVAKSDGPIPESKQQLYARFPILQKLYRLRLYWVHELMAIGFVVSPSIMKLFGRLALRYLYESVKDHTLREKLTPDYVIGCKRILMSNEYYPALQRPNVTLVTDTIDHIEAKGVVTKEGKLHEVDAIIMATGFQAAEGVIRFETIGLNGTDLNDTWRDGAEAYLGTSVAGFPNMYTVVGPNTGLGHTSMLLMIEAQVEYIISCLKTMNSRSAKYAMVKVNVQREYNKKIQKELSGSIWQSGGCHSWYQMKNGKNVTLWPGFTFTFMRQTRHFDPSKYDWVQ